MAQAVVAEIRAARRVVGLEALHAVGHRVPARSRIDRLVCGVRERAADDGALQLVAIARGSGADNGPGQPADEGTLLGASVRIIGIGVCLLYTSDAADE